MSETSKSTGASKGSGQAGQDKAQKLQDERAAAAARGDDTRVGQIDDELSNLALGQQGTQGTQK